MIGAIAAGWYLFAADQPITNADTDETSGATIGTLDVRANPKNYNGGVRSQIRTGLRCFYPKNTVNFEKNSEPAIKNAENACG